MGVKDAKTHVHHTKIGQGEGWTSLGRSNILEGTVSVDGRRPPDLMEIDYEAGQARWIKGTFENPTRVFEFDYKYMPILEPEPLPYSLEDAVEALLEWAKTGDAGALTDILDKRG